VASQAEKADRFRAMHASDGVLLMPNAWDVGSARLLQSLGFDALATTSGGFAATLGRLDYGVTREEALAHSTQIAAAVDVPVSADLENCFADDPDGVAETILLALGTGVAGCSIEDATGDPDAPIYDAGLAAERVTAAAEAAHGRDVPLVLTARCENFLHGRPDLDDTINRLQAYEAAGADVLFAPGVVAADDIRRVVESVDRPVSVLAMRGCPPVAELAAIGVRRVSVGGAFAYTALAAVVEAATELRDDGTYGYLERSRSARRAVVDAFTD
jgi:2-methylisocitrate lyase-like PEP mutase family enzyme